MGRYKVIAGQNIYDIALHIYGSIEGIVDLMMCNTDLSLDTTLKVGDELIYSDDFINHAERDTNTNPLPDTAINQ